jgi:hypothetical protein
MGRRAIWASLALFTPSFVWQLAHVPGVSLLMDTEKTTLRLRLFEFLTLPAQGWMWLVGRLLGYRFECGPVSGPDDH